MNLLRSLPNFEVRPELGLVQRAAARFRTTHPLHLIPDGQSVLKSQIGKKAELGNFGQMVLDALEQTNNQILEGQLLQQQAIVSPDSVDPSTLVVSMLKADMSLSLSKAVLDRAVAAYKELTSVR